MRVVTKINYNYCFRCEKIGIVGWNIYYEDAYVTRTNSLEEAINIMKQLNDCRHIEVEETED